jgi:anhydro-N-acetylmuramic acid kinase
LFANATRNRVILNIGGIANVTLLPTDATPVIGFDTGPGNTLLDTMSRQYLDRPFDADGAWSAAGKVSGELLHSMLADPYFELPPPKSTGFEYFNADWLRAYLASLAAADLPTVDVQATLAELTAQSIATAIGRYLPEVDEVFICGGGLHNADLVRRITGALAPAKVGSTGTCGLDPDWVEAAAFAWLAKRRLEGKPGNLPSVTGASRPTVLGAVYLCSV